MDTDRLIPKSIETIVSRSLKGGGFALRQNGRFRPDATAWSILALTAGNIRGDLVEKGCIRLAAGQLADGRIPVAEDLENAYWPTPLAVLAWQSSGGFDNEINRAVKFLVKTSGLHFPREKNSPNGHDTSIRGWSWVENTHSWIEPTSMAILALKATGNTGCDRVWEAVRMILDRKLPSGGWNYGNTTVFNREFPPVPENTGQALCALSGFVRYPEIAKSIDYLVREISTMQTPLSLCWGLFGLGAWSVKIRGSRERILNSLSLQQRYGPYDTSLLSKLVIAYNMEGNLSELIMKNS